MGREGARRLLKVESLLGRGESLPTPTTPRPSASAPSATAEGRRSTVLDPGWSPVLGLARDTARREARNGAWLASEGMEGPLALEVESAGEGR